jgi:hypothetical protein
VQLPNADLAIIEPSKLHDYLLSPLHPLGRFKAAFFISLGYSPERWQELDRDIREQHLILDAEPGETTKYGQKYLIQGPLRGPGGTIVQLVSVWIIQGGEETPRFVTAYPG